MAKLKMYEVDSITDAVVESISKGKREESKLAVQKLNEKFKSEIDKINKLGLEIYRAKQERDNMMETLDDVAREVRKAEFRIHNWNPEKPVMFVERDWCYVRRDDIRREVVLSSMEGSEVRGMIDKLVEKFKDVE